MCDATWFGGEAAAPDGVRRTKRSATMSVRFHLFGRFRCVRNGDHLSGLDGHKAAEFLAYLVLNRGRPLRREALAAALWGANSTQQSLKYLRQALWKLHALAAEPWACVRIERDWLVLDPGDAWIDVEAFERALDDTRDRSGYDIDEAAALQLRSAATLYAGDLLDGWDQEWCVLERERLRERYLALLDKLMDHAIHRGSPEEGLAHGSASLAVDGAREATHQRLMQLHYLAGDRTAALRQFERCARSLADEFGVGPGRRTEALREAIGADRGVYAAAAASARHVQTTDVADDLRRLQDMVNLLQRQHAPGVDEGGTRP